VATVGAAAALAWLAAAAAPAALGAQPAATPSVDGTRLRPAADTLVTTTATGAEVDTLGWATHTLEPIRIAAGPAWRFVYHWRGRDGADAADTLELDARTLRPLRGTHVTVHGRAAIDYPADVGTGAGAGMRVAITRAQGSRYVFDTTVAGPVFAAASLALVVRALPDTSGHVTEVDVYFPFPARLGARRVRVTVGGSARVPGPDGRPVDCWVAEARLPAGAIHFWVAKDTRALVQTATDRGGMTLWSRRPGA
jgi:hypothetical protein